MGDEIRKRSTDILDLLNDKDALDLVRGKGKGKGKIIGYSYQRENQFLSGEGLELKSENSSQSQVRGRSMSVPQVSTSDEDMRMRELSVEKLSKRQQPKNSKKVVRKPSTSSDEESDVQNEVKSVEIKVKTPSNTTSSVTNLLEEDDLLWQGSGVFTFDFPQNEVKHQNVRRSSAPALFSMLDEGTELNQETPKLNPGMMMFDYNNTMFGSMEDSDEEMKLGGSQEFRMIQQQNEEEEEEVMSEDIWEFGKTLANIDDINLTNSEKKRRENIAKRKNMHKNGLKLKDMEKNYKVDFEAMGPEGSNSMALVPFGQLHDAPSCGYLVPYNGYGYSNELRW